MGILDSIGNPSSAALSSAISSFAELFSGPPKYVGADFPEGFVIHELPATGVGVELKLLGEWMPHQPFTWGGEQKLAKEYYPGNPEPTVQVLGGRETELTIQGRFKAKRIHEKGDSPLRRAPQALADAIDAMRKRGNLVRIALGEWERWCFIETTVWEMKTLADIGYKITFFVIGDSAPSSCKLSGAGFTVPVDLNIALIEAASSLEALGSAPFEGMSVGLFDQLNKALGAVATALAVVTKFVDLAVSTAEDAQKFANRAIGLIKYAQAQIASFKRRVGALQLYLGMSATTSETLRALQAKYVTKLQLATTKPIQLSPDQKAVAAAKPANYSSNPTTQAQAAAKAGGKSIDQTLSEMLVKFQQMVQYTPKARHLVREGDNLQTISVKYYATPDNWKKIYTHNQLTSTALVAGRILEIPRL